MSLGGNISLRGVEVHNLKRINLDIPRGRLVVLCGLSGSGKSSLAFDTLYAEGQRRYIESFSAYTRQFLERLEKPAAERIEGIPPAIAVSSKSPSRSSRSTVGTTTETTDYLRLLMAKIGRMHCLKCGGAIQQHSPHSIVEQLESLPPGLRYCLAFEVALDADANRDEVLATLREDGFSRVLANGQWAGLDAPALLNESSDAPLVVIVDRLTSGSTATDRLRDSVELALSRGQGRVSAYVDAESKLPAGLPVTGTVRIEDRDWQRLAYSTALRCDVCNLDYPQPEPRLFSFNSPLGACPECEGFGNVVDIDFELIVPDPSKSLREGAIAPWNTPAYRHELDELLALAKDYDLPVDVPFAQLEPQHLELIRNGVPEREFGGLKGFFNWLERRKYKMHIRVFLSRWRSYRPCPACGGSRLRPEALAASIGGKNLAQLSTMRIRECLAFFEQLELSDWEQQVGRVILEPIRARLAFLSQVGLDYLSLDRTLRTLSGGESQRVALTSALGSSLVNMLYVLDEPSIGLHPRDTDRLLQAILKLRDRGNTVVVVEHEEAMIRAADQVIEIGPGAGERGGEVVFQGTPAEMAASPTSLTGDFLSGRRVIRTPGKRRTPNHGWIRLAGARGNNLQNLTVEFPLGTLCVVSGVSGAGKSTLVQDTLYPALCRRLRKDGPIPAPFDDVYGDGQIDDVQLVDQNPIGRSPRSNPVTYIKAFDEIRHVFAETLDARTRNYTAGHFSFNVEGGRCNVCEGDGFIEIDMQFMADVYMKCAQCGGKRYRPEILDITYRGRNIAEVLDMTVREAFTFFRGHTKVQTRLKRLIDVGLDYLRLGQGANTLSGGEAQRLKLAAYMPASTRNRCLFILDEPTTGLHFADVVQLLDCFDALLAVGHSLIVIEHSLPVIRSADHLIELGPGAAEEGGRIVAHGTPELVARNKQSVTGRFLAQAFADDLQEQSA
jgi:excinuclease ABC subunit A